MTKNNNEANDSLSINEASILMGVTPSALYLAMKKKRLKVYKNPNLNRWEIKNEDLEEYIRTKYSRAKTVFEGALLFDHEKGFYSVSQASKVFDIEAQRLYHAIRSKRLKATRKGGAWVLHIDDIEDYKNWNENAQ